MTNNQNSLDEILDGVFSHEDGDGFTCASRYRTCQECGQRYYFMNLHSKHPDAKQIDGPCDCSVKTEKAEFSAAINKTIMEARVAELERLLDAGHDRMPSGTQRINADTGRVEFMKGHQIVHDFQIKDRIAELRQQITKKYGRADNE